MYEIAHGGLRGFIPAVCTNLPLKCSSVRMEPCRWAFSFGGCLKPRNSTGHMVAIAHFLGIAEACSRKVLSSLSELLIGYATSLSGITLAVSVTLPATISRMTFSH